MLEILHKLLSNHDIGLDDFIDQHVEVQGEGTGLVQKPPGHTLMIHMLNDTSMLKMVSLVCVAVVQTGWSDSFTGVLIREFLFQILYIIDEATKLFDKCTPFPGKY